MGNPVFSEYNPRDISWQYEVKKFMRKDYDYEKHGLLELLLSGSVGSAKSIFAANMMVSHCLKYPGAVGGLFRRTMPDLKATIYATIVEHIEGSEIEIDGHKDVMKEGVHYVTRKSIGEIEFANKSIIRSKSWDDGKYEKLRSHNYSAGIWEEVTENISKVCKKVHPELISRVGRVNSLNSEVQENWLLYLTNPDSTEHWCYKYFLGEDENEASQET